MKRSPLVKGGVAKTAFAAQLLDRHTRIGFPQKTNDLFFRESALLHARHSPEFDGLRELSGGTGYGGQVNFVFPQLRVFSKKKPPIVLRSGVLWGAWR